MKIVQKFEADDGTSFDSEQECADYEAALPFVKLLTEVEAAVKADAAFAKRIEMLGTKLARERVARGEKRQRKPNAKEDPARAITGAAASADRRAEEGREDTGLAGSVIESLKDAAE